MAKQVKRGWFIEHSPGEAHIAIVEKTSRTVDGITDEWQAVTETGLKVVVEFVTVDSDLSANSLTGSYNEIPSRYHKAIVDKAIAMGYRDPRNQNIQNAQYFETLYIEAKRRGKKLAKSNFQTTGRIVPQDF